MRASVITGCNSAPILEPCEHIFDLMSLFICCFTELCGRASPFSGRDTGCDTFSHQGLPVFVAVITFIGDHDDILSLGQSLIEDFSPGRVTDLSRRQAKAWRTASLICYDVDFGIQPALWVTDTLHPPPLTACALCLYLPPQSKIISSRWNIEIWQERRG